MNTTTGITPNRDLASALKSKRILVVDDDPVVVATVAAHLCSGGFSHVRQETDSRLVIDAIREYEPDMIVLDIFMPHISGLELLEQISANAEFDKVIVLMLSAAGLQEEDRALELGAMGFLPKPTNAEELIRIISTTFRITNRFGSR